MQFDRQTHWQFLNDELRAEVEEFKKTFEAKATSLLNNSEEMFVGQFMSFKNGEMIVRFPNTRAIPRKSDFLYCMLLPKELRNFHNWGNRTYEDLYKCRYKATECSVIWQTPCEDPRLTLVGFHRVDVEFQSMIEAEQGIVLVFAPQMPPTAYIVNLQKIVTNTNSIGVSKVLDVDYKPNNWRPVLIKDADTAEFVMRQLALSNTMILQGPPGTGKTTLIADICAKLLAQRKSVLVTALTNRALMEIAEKQSLAPALQSGCVWKTNMTTDENQELRQLESLKQISPILGAVVLSTFFISSGYASSIAEEAPFDYVIMDEASQAVTAMFAASARMGKKCLWVGDTQQLPPIVMLNDDIIQGENYRPLVNGLYLMVSSSSLPIYQLTKTYRFGKRASDFTGKFYGGTLCAEKDKMAYIIPSLRNILHIHGGPSLVLTDMPAGDASPNFAIQMATYLVGKILQEDKHKEVAVLTCLIKTTKALQKSIARSIGNGTNLIVDTIARVQGLTTDIVIYFIPNYSYLRTIEPHLFNVATSRAREHTIIIADKNILLEQGMDINVRDYLQTLYAEEVIYIPANSKTKQILTPLE